MSDAVIGKIEPPIVLPAPDSEEAKQATERFLQVMDGSMPDRMREVVSLGNDDSGNPLQVIVWRKP